jgi:hypothetical protein
VEEKRAPPKGAEKRYGAVAASWSTSGEVEPLNYVVGRCINGNNGKFGAST